MFLYEIKILSIRNFYASRQSSVAIYRREQRYTVNIKIPLLKPLDRDVGRDSGDVIDGPLVAGKT